MDLLLWRHAEAQEQAPRGGDLARALTHAGEQQAARAAGWLARHLPAHTRIVCSPALRCQQTVRALGREYEVDQALAPGSSAAAVLEAAGWPAARGSVLVVGHQPTLGQAVATLLAMQGGECAIRKGAVWWLRSRGRAGHAEVTLLAVQSPELM